MELKYKRILLKLSGEALAGSVGHGIDFDTVMEICKPIRKIVDMGAQVAIVVGGGISGGAAAAAAWIGPGLTIWACWLR